jgi:NAD(P)-dependent dehydrogenase (short-subunit alcohol dehydrogenase family)
VDKENAMASVVVITGASGGVGRACAVEFASRGAQVGLLARGTKGLDAAVGEVEHAGGRAVAVPADVSDYRQVRLAAETFEDQLGPIDVWVNCAFTSVFADFTDISPQEYQRVTEVTYLGCVNGTREALRLMMPRGSGVIVQVGSALGERAIPLQSAYCGAKHAINGFSSSLRVELLRRGSGVHVTVVQLPAVNTPQFSWVRSRLPRHPQPVPPIYQPEVAARAVVHAAAHPRRKQYYVGASTTATIWANRFAASVLDRYLARTGTRSQQSDQPPADNGDNLFTPLDGPDGRDFGAHGDFDSRSHDRAPQFWATSHRRALVAAAGVGALGATLARRRHGR